MLILFLSPSGRSVVIHFVIGFFDCFFCFCLIALLFSVLSEELPWTFSLASRFP